MNRSHALVGLVAGALLKIDGREVRVLEVRDNEPNPLPEIIFDDLPRPKVRIAAFRGSSLEVMMRGLGAR